MLNPLRDVKNALICSTREFSSKALQNITFCLLSHPNDVYIAGISLRCFVLLAALASFPMLHQQSNNLHNLPHLFIQRSLFVLIGRKSTFRAVISLVNQEEEEKHKFPESELLIEKCLSLDESLGR